LFKEAEMGGILISLLSLAAMASGFPSTPQTISVEEILKKAEGKISAAVDSLKKTPENPFFARTDAPLKTQEELAAVRVETIEKLLKTEGFDSPDYDKIVELTTEILVKAPDTKSAQIAHWNMHTYFLIYENTRGAKDALMTYLHKYEADQSRRKEAFDKLSIFSADEKEWDLALYYSEKYLALEPTSYPRLLNKARALVNLGFLAEGKALLHRIDKENPDSVEANLARTALNELETAKFDPDVLAGFRKTMEIMREIGAAAEMYHLENSKYPRAIKDLFPDFLKELTEKDAWGGAFICKIDTENDRFLVASSGSDGVFEGFDQEGLYLDLSGKDIIFTGGAFLYGPRLKTP
jgi:tetratricopeptide (TPR) repeat protein